MVQDPMPTQRTRRVVGEKRIKKGTKREGGQRGPNLPERKKKRILKAEAIEETKETKNRREVHA